MLTDCFLILKKFAGKDKRHSFCSAFGNLDRLSSFISLNYIIHYCPNPFCEIYQSILNSQAVSSDSGFVNMIPCLNEKL